MVRQWCIWCCVMQPSCPTNAHRCSCGAPRLCTMAPERCSNGAPWWTETVLNASFLFLYIERILLSKYPILCRESYVRFFGCQLSIEQSLDRPHTALRDSNTIQNTYAVCWKPVLTSQNKTTIRQWIQIGSVQPR